MADQGSVVRKAVLPVTTGKQTKEEARKFIRAQVPYRNFAGVLEDLDKKVETLVINHRERFRGRMSTAMERWAINWAAANGESTWQQREDDIHIPETKKALDSKVVRIEEALTDFDPMFVVKGRRGDMPRYDAQIVGSYVHGQMEMGGFREMIQPAARDAELCNAACVKVVWERRIEDVVDRKFETKFKADGTPEFHDERRYVTDRVVFNGPRYYLVDPFWLFFDIDAAKVEDCEYIGDESEVFVHELEQQADLGIFSKKQVDLVKKRRAGNTTQMATDGVNRIELTDQQRMARSIASASAFTTENRGEQTAMRVRVIECWFYYDFGEGFEGIVDPLGRKVQGVRKVVATLANGVVIRFQLNPHDKKFAPYAMCRISRNGHEMVAPANFDQVVQLNAQYDSVRSDTLRQHALTVAPICFADAGADLPDTILDVMPGTIVKGANKNQIEIVKLPEVNPGTIQYQDMFYRQNIEESSGAMRVYEQQQNTATETERKVQEQQRLVRNSIVANGELWRQVALITYHLSAQFADGVQRFAVVGKAASVLGKFAEVTPDLLLEDVDFQFVGVRDMHTFGNKEAGRAQWMNQWASLLVNMPGINLMALARLDYERRVGSSNIDEVFTEAVPVWDTMPQEEENVYLRAGRKVPVSRMDDDVDHMKKLAPLITGKGVPAYVRNIAIEHFNLHMAQAMQKEQREKAEMAEAERRGRLMAPGGGEPGKDQAPASGGMPAQQKGVTPGPTQERTVAKSGRQGAGISQSQSMAS